MIENQYADVKAMTFAEAWAESYRVALAGWGDDVWIQQWEEHLWVYVSGNRYAPYCPTPEEMTGECWVPR